MQLIVYCKRFCRPIPNGPLQSPGAVFCYLTALLLLSATAFSQTVRLSLKNEPLTTVFKAVEQQTPYRFIYTREELAMAVPVTLSVRNAPVEEVLQQCFANQPLTYSIVDHFIKVQQKVGAVPTQTPLPPGINIHGRVTSEQGEPLPGASVVVKGTPKATATDEKGEFRLVDVEKGAVLLVSSIGYKLVEVVIGNNDLLLIQLQQQVSSLDETVVIAYGTTTRRLNTGSVGRVTAYDISQQPVANPLAALQGRVPGLLVTQSSGVPGASFKVQVRGQNSLQQGSEPLFVIDGIPFAPNNNPLNRLSSIAGAGENSGLSPFNAINPADIESIEVLKDADATAIYGSRGANGVVLITTKKGKAGKTRLDVNLQQGISRVVRRPRLLNTPQYLSMRREAFQNDGLTPDPQNAPDLLVWDTTRYTDFAKLLTGGTAGLTDAQVSLSGGSAQTQFLLRGAYRHQGTVFPGDMYNNSGSGHLSLNHASENQKLKVHATGSYATDISHLIAVPLADYTSLTPNTPVLYDEEGKLNWQEGGVSFDNPLAYLQRSYRAVTDNLISNAIISYKFMPGLVARVSAGYNSVLVQEKSKTPKGSQNPALSPTGAARWATNGFKSYQVEPQLDYTRTVARGTLQMLVGGTWQQNKNEGNSLQATGYTDDALLGSVTGAANTVADNQLAEYRYQALFGRLQYNWQDRYLLNFSGRRDGSSRFGPGKRLANFGAGGAAWIFSNTAWVKNKAAFLSFGKLRGSYGTTGNDQIGDYRYLDAWTNTRYPYGGQPGLFPAFLFNADYHWEINRKWEGALELGFWNNRVLLSTAYFRNRSSNQLILYMLPAQTGFSTMLKNFPAVVQNAGVEGELTTKNVTGRHFQWETSLHITLPRNKLVAFPGLASSSYAALYQEGASINLLQGYAYTGVDPLTGLYTFEDVDKDGLLSPRGDYLKHGSLDPKYYGGFRNSLHYKGISLDIFFEFRKQLGRNFLSTFRALPPGSMANQPEEVLSRWQKPGDQAPYGMFTSSTFTPAYGAIRDLALSNAVYSDASFIRLKNLSLSYRLPATWLQKIGAVNSRVFLQGQNLLTLTSFEGADPEVQSYFELPPLQTLAAGFQLTF